MIDMTKSPINSQAPVASAPKRSLTPRRRAREYALQGVYQSLVMRRAGSLPNASAIAKQLAEDAGFRRCQLELFQ
jgi:N utilization substance protein B